MDAHLAHAAEVAHAHRIRGRVFLVRNLLCGAALLGGGIAGLMSLQEAKDQQAAEAKAGATSNTPTNVPFKAYPANGSISVDRTVIAGWKDKGRLLNSPSVATEMAGRPVNPTRNPLDMLNFNREWDFDAGEVLSKATKDVKSDPAALFVDTTEVAKASAASGGRQYTERFPHVGAMADMTDDIPASARDQWRELVGHAEQATSVMAKARTAGTNAERYGLYSAAKASLRKGLTILNDIEESGQSTHWAFGVAGEFLRSMLMDCNKGARTE